MAPVMIRYSDVHWRDPRFSMQSIEATTSSRASAVNKTPMQFQSESQLQNDLERHQSESDEVSIDQESVKVQQMPIMQSYQSLHVKKAQN